MKIFFFLIVVSQSALAHRLKDIATIQGIRDNPIVGYGVVVGVQGTGDKGLPLTEQSLQFLLKEMGVHSPQKIETKNVASVFVTATLPPFSRVGNRLDIEVSSMGSATSLEGGFLMITPLKGADGIVYAMAQGKILNDKKENRGRGGKEVRAVVPGGAIIERDMAVDLTSLGELSYVLRHPDITTAARVAKQINLTLGGYFANAKDASTIHFTFPRTLTSDRIEILSQIENIEVETDKIAKVVVNAKNGTVILGENVRMSPVAIAHHNFKVEVRPPIEKNIRQLGSEGENEVSRENVSPVTEASKPTQVALFDSGASISELVTSLNEMGVSPDDLVEILQLLKSSGSLMAELEIQ